MDYNIQAFVSIPSLSNNTKGVVSALGELSDIAKTFAREKQYFDKPSNYSSVSLVVYNCADAASAGTVTDQIEITDAMASPALYLSQTILDGYDQTTSIEAFIAANVTGNFTVETSSSPVVVNGKSLPKYLKVSFVDTNDTYNYQLWYSDAEFRSSGNYYTGYEIVVIPPVTDMDGGMYAAYSVANAAYLDQQKNRKLLTSNINAIISANPATTIETFDVKWNDPADITKTIDTEWTMVCYGSAANSPTNLLAAIRTWLSANSAYTIEQWLSYFPDIETTDFFMFIPLWNQTSKVSSGTLLYSPVVKFNSTITQSAKFFPTMTSTEVQALMEELPVKYGQLAVIAVPGQNNAPTRISFYDVFSDYSVLTVNTPQAGAYSDATLAAIEALESMMALAESYNTLAPDLPVGTTAVDNAGNIPFRTLERSVGSFVFKVVTKESYLSINP